MKRLFTLLTLLILSFGTDAQVSLTFMSDAQLTPNSTDTSGVFCRTFYHPGRNKFYVVYASRALVSPPGSNQYFRWEERDSNFDTTGVKGTLSNFLGGVGDYAMVMVGNSYYHVTGTGIGPTWKFRLTKYDDDFNLVDSVSFFLDSSDSNADMLLNYTNGKLIIGAFHQAGFFHPTMPNQSPAWTPNMHKWEYDTSLVALTAPVFLNETYTPWGASCIFNNNLYNVITFDKFKGPYNPNYNLSVYRYDSNWNYIDSIALNNDGQWSQGVLWDGNYYYVAYHSGRSHRSGNITVGIYDINWSLIYDTTITNNAIFDTISNNPPLNITQYNANRPVLTKVNDTLYVSYDQDDYVISDYGPAPLFTFGNRWQAHVTKLKINGVTGIEDTKSNPLLTIYPNPASNSINIYSSENGIVQIFDVTGQIIFSMEINAGNHNLPIDTYTSGLYFVSLNTEKTTIQRKIIIQ